MNARTIVLVQGFLLSALPLAGCGSEEAVEIRPAAAETGPRVVTAVPVALKDFKPSLAATGTLMPRRHAELRALAEGCVEVLPVDIGARVRKGQLLLQVRTVDYENALRQAEASLLRAQVLLRDRERERDRMKGLEAEGSATGQMRDAAFTAFEEAAAAVAQAEAVVASAKQVLNDCTVLAPYDGVVTARHLQQGEYANKADRVLEIMDLAYLEAELEIPEPHAGQIQPGFEVDLKVGASAEKTSGQVIAVNPKVDVALRTFRVKVAVDNRDGRFQAGLFCTADFRLAVRTRRPAVPVEALLRDEGRSTVWVVRDGKATARAVREGAQTDGWVEIVDGLAEGELVVTAGGGGLTEGYAVTLEGEAKPKA